jgi:NitT/TauT family transport system substrate-binding protein
MSCRSSRSDPSLTNLDEIGLDVTMTTAQGGDKSIAALLGGVADIALIGPETAIYVQNSESPTKVRIFGGLTATDGFLPRHQRGCKR